MNERKTSSMLQRVPVILAVTAASYGLQLPPHVARQSGASASNVPARMHTGEMPRTASLARAEPGADRKA